MGEGLNYVLHKVNSGALIQAVRGEVGPLQAPQEGVLTRCLKACCLVGQMMEAGICE